MSFFSNWFSPGSYENYDDETSRQDYFEEMDQEDAAPEESKPSQVEEICGKCGGSGFFEGSGPYGGGTSNRETCIQCDGKGRV